MPHYYTYTLRRHLPRIRAEGMYTNSLSFTPTEYYSKSQAGQALGVMDHHIDCVLKFVDDGRFREFHERVPSTNRFSGGGLQYGHPGRPKPVAVRNILSRTWEVLNATGAPTDSGKPE
jgi:hypothetical protein